VLDEVVAVNVSSPISSVIPSVHGVVLAVLARTYVPLSGRRIAELTDGRASPRRVNDVLRELAEAGIVLRESHPPAYLYRLNRDHVAAPGIEALTEMRGELLDRMRKALAEWAPPSPPAAWMFGSAARGDGSVRSDIDILLLRPDDVDIADEVWAQKFSDFARAVENWSGNYCELVEFSEAEFADMVANGERLVEELRRDSTHLAGDTFHERSRRAS
jgi:predicted nucleotidyltransferase